MFVHWILTLYVCLNLSFELKVWKMMEGIKWFYVTRETSCMKCSNLVLLTSITMNEPTKSVHWIPHKWTIKLLNPCFQMHMHHLVQALYMTLFQLECLAIFLRFCLRSMCACLLGNGGHAKSKSFLWVQNVSRVGEKVDLLLQWSTK